MAQKKTEQQQLQNTLREAVNLLTTEQKRKVLAFIRLLRQEWNGELQEGIKLLDAEQCRRVLEEIALMPGEGKPNNGGRKTD